MCSRAPGKTEEKTERAEKSGHEAAHRSEKRGFLTEKNKQWKRRRKEKRERRGSCFPRPTHLERRGGRKAELRLVPPATDQSKEKSSKYPQALLLWGKKLIREEKGSPADNLVDRSHYTHTSGKQSHFEKCRGFKDAFADSEYQFYLLFLLPPLFKGGGPDVKWEKWKSIKYRAKSGRPCKKGS